MLSEGRCPCDSFAIDTRSQQRSRWARSPAATKAAKQALPRPGPVAGACAPLPAAPSDGFETKLQLYARALCTGTLLKPATQQQRLQSTTLESEPSFVQYTKTLFPQYVNW